MTQELNGDRSGSATGSDDDAVGYKRPPRKHQFKPGQSGNPAGRKKGAAGLRQILEGELTSKVRINRGSEASPQIVALSKLQIVVKRLVDKAMNGDQRSIEHLITLNISMFGLGHDEVDPEGQLSPGELAYLEAMTNRHSAGDAAAGHKADQSLIVDVDEEGDGDVG